VQDAISGLKNGTIDPSKEIKIEGIETETQRKAKDDEAAQRKTKYLVPLVPRTTSKQTSYFEQKAIVVYRFVSSTSTHWRFRSRVSIPALEGCATAVANLTPTA
jgi:hypothetical protein